ncbi:hypothetical protein BIW11_10447 [Tropilaelaps mercedesae]|uniref:Cadherin domain-containing protein n=1 Tax=Tropilaelaps mercedesae TaxID=418985 RepID=A0A1V9XG40_9ACAR|nr:hypothetical protein BIW11_10447 [Tropilaelaps mercedesae]
MLITINYLCSSFQNTQLNTTVGYIRARDNPSSYLPVVFEVTVRSQNLEQYQKKSKHLLFYNFTFKGSPKFWIKYVFGPKGVSQGALQLKESLDYEAQNVYYVQVAAINTWTDREVDTRNIIVLSMCIVVEDAPDTPPHFVGVPPVVVVNDNTKMVSC